MRSLRNEVLVHKEILCSLFAKNSLFCSLLAMRSLRNEVLAQRGPCSQRNSLLVFRKEFFVLFFARKEVLAQRGPCTMKSLRNEVLVHKEVLCLLFTKNSLFCSLLARRSLRKDLPI